MQEKRCKICGYKNKFTDIICSMCGNDISDADNYEVVGDNDATEFQSESDSQEQENNLENNSDTYNSQESEDRQDINSWDEKEHHDYGKKKSRVYPDGKRRIWSIGFSRFVAVMLTFAVLLCALVYRIHTEDTVIESFAENIKNKFTENRSLENTVEDMESADSNTSSKDRKKVNNTYILKESNKKVISLKKLKKLSLKKLAIARNEIYARNGYKFTQKKWRNYFKKKKWYKPRYSAKYFQKHSKKLLNKYERKNIERIREVEKEKKR